MAVSKGKSIWKAFSTGVIFLVGFMLAEFLKTPEASLPIGAILVGLWNYIKHSAGIQTI